MAAIDAGGPAWDALCEALGRAPGARERFEAIDAARRSLLGPGLLTVSAFEPAQARLRRLWSSDLQAYPVGGAKHKADTPWARQVLQRGEPFVGEGEAALAQAFDDHARILALGLRSVVNVPLQWQGHCRGTFNLLRPGARWAPGEILTVRLLALAALPALLQARARDKARASE